MSWLDDAAASVASVAAGAAADVDRDARFPDEAVAAMRTSGLLHALVPTGERPAASTAEMVKAIATVAAACGSSGLILAMHQIQVGLVARHGSPAMKDRVLGTGPLLIASAASEAGLGGTRFASRCALVADGDRFHLEKDAATLSYGVHADVVIASARRHPEAEAGDQVLGVAVRPELTFTPTGGWDALGMRGTESFPGRLEATVGADMVIADFRGSFIRTGLPLSTIFLSAVWLGLAEAAGAQAHALRRSVARSNHRAGTSPGPLPMVRLAELATVLRQLRSVVYEGAADYDRLKDADPLDSYDVLAQWDHIKVAVSSIVMDVVVRALAVCGLSGYINSSEYSVGRILRDAAAAPIMINADRSLEAIAGLMMMRRQL